MPRATTCIFGGRKLDVEEALRLRDTARQNGEEAPYFRCLLCNEPVRPQRGGASTSAHFVHYARNPQCSLSAQGK